jgi:type IV pilus assembly protein PilY1
MNILKHKKHLNPKGLLLSAGVAWGIVSMGAVLADTIAKEPLFITSSVGPNILFILDDSGSMNESYLPESINVTDDDINNNGATPIANNARLSASVNTLYYDPKITYAPPVDQNGKSLGDSLFTGAWKDGYASYPAHGGITVDLSTAFRATWGPNSFLGAAQPAYYYLLVPGCTDIYYNDSCYKKVSATDPWTAAEKQNFANWYSYYRTRIMLARAGISRAFAKLGVTPRVGYGRINKSIPAAVDGPNLDTVERPVRAFSGKDRKDFFDWLFTIQPAGSTPLRRALDSAGLYYINGTSTGPWSSTPGVTGGALSTCRQSYTILMTDGYWNGEAAAFSPQRADNDSTEGAIITGPNGASFGYKPVPPFKDDRSNTLADIAMYYWKTDLSTIANEVPVSTLDPAFWQHMVTYGVGLGVPTSIPPNDAFSAIGTGATVAWPDPDTSHPDNDTVARIDDLLHASVNSRGGFFNAKNPDQLTTKLNETLSKIISDSAGAASAAAANSTQLNAGTRVYQATFNPKDWSGKLQAFSVNTTTGALTSSWEVSTLLPAHADRNIYTYNPAAVAGGSRGALFQWDNLTKDSDDPAPLPFSQQTYLNTLAGANDSNGALRVAWLRGDSANEKMSDTDINSAHIFRKRTNFLGDIVNSDSVYVGTEDYGYGSSSYKSFLTTKKSRKPMLYVGANDGMLHGFNADSSEGGQEIFAYIPNALFSELSKLTSPAYTHQYYVDGASAVGDVNDGTNWRTVLAGSTGAGGKAVFGLDVTTPDAFGVNSVLWEFTNTTKADGAPNPDGGDLGYTLAQPAVVRLQDGRWAVIVANGYNSDNGHAVLFVLDALTGAVLQKIDTGAGDPVNKNGLSSPIAVDTDNDLSVDTVYAGDLYGNLWKFKLDGVSGIWTIPNNKPFFVACAKPGESCDPADRQPITGKPNYGQVGVLGSDQNGVGRMVYFGTGKYFETRDGTVDASPQVQTFYGLWDRDSAITDRAGLQEQTINFEGFADLACAATSTCPTAITKTTNPIRVTSKSPVCYAASSVGCTSSSPLKSGWALNLSKPNNAAEGERAVSFPLVRRGLVIFATVIPDPDPCKAGGRSWLMEVDALGGEKSGGAPFDVNGDGKVNAYDFVTVEINGVKVTTVASGSDQGNGVAQKQPAKVESAVSCLDFGYTAGSKSPTPKLGLEKGCDVGVGVGRRSWRQLR